jgi:transposase
MPKRKRERRERTHDWQQIQQYTLWPEQKAYELLRPVVLFGETAAERAKETGASERTLHHKADQFDQEGMASLFHTDSTPSPDKSRTLPPDMRQLIVDLKAEHPGFRPNEIATICFLRFGRRPSPHTVQRVLADGPKPSLSGRRYPPYAQIADGYQRRRAMVDLHAQGWSITTIAAYLQTPRHRVYEVLKRWAQEGHAGLDDKPKAPHHPARKVTIREINEVKKHAGNPDIGAYRVMAALEQIGLKLSRATCGRLLALNRQLYGIDVPKGGAPRQKKEMPFRASFRHEWWSVDVRYIEEHRLPDVKGAVYLISILENYSRAVLASKISPTQNQWDYLEVLFAAFSTAGVPKGIVSDGGGIFYCKQAMDVYAALGIRKERIHKRQAWENYIEAHFNIVRRMADAKFAVATSWEQMIATHRKWMMDYNTQRHWAHEKREDGCHSPAEVIGWHKGTMYPQEFLDRILFATRYTRQLDKHGFVRFQNWKLYGERGLAHEPVTVWVYEGTLKVAYKAVTLSKYAVELQEDRKHVRQVSNPRLAETPFHSPQLTLIDVGPHEWLLYWKAPSYAPMRRKRGRPQEIIQPPLFDLPTEAKAVGASDTGAVSGPRPSLHLVSRPSDEPDVKE